MAEVTMDDAKLKALFKSALIEVLEERRELLRDVIEESLEDLALSRAIEAGRHTQDVTSREVFSLVESNR